MTPDTPTPPIADRYRLADFEAARARIAPYVRHTPIAPALPLRDDLPPTLRLKLENLQVTGSFKVRGVFNTLLQLDPDTRTRGVIASSGGNHGVAVAYAAHRLGIPAVVYLPETTTPDRVARVSLWGAQVIQHGIAWDDAHARALVHAEAEGLSYVHPFGVPSVILGQGTLGLELLDDLPAMDALIVAVGGGGLIAGVSAAIAARAPGVRIFGVEPTGAASMLHALTTGSPQPLAQVRTIADTLAARQVAEDTLALTQAHTDGVVTVSDAEMIAGMRWLWLHYNQLVEPATAAVAAALISGRIDLTPFAQPVALICGGNAAAGSVWAYYEELARAKGSLDEATRQTRSVPS